ncbi:MAG TPA: peptide ABC transporter substrate-binding protein [Opitutaceae bacterium]|nr:peptide ABC transporter substrate-binding protein [Opitutaceae bacterium]
MRVRRFVALLCVSAATFLVTGCSRRETPVDEGIRTHTLLAGNTAEPADLDPHLASILSDQIIVNTLFEGLTLLDERTTNPLPAAAEKWSVSPDGLVWTFRLREGLQWSNGDPLTADDFVQSWRRILRPDFAAENAWYLFALKNAEAFNARKLGDSASVGVAAPDARTLVLTLERPTPYLPALVSMPAWFPVNPRALAKFGAMEKRSTAWTRAGNLVSNGAFMLGQWTPNARIVLQKNPRHREAAQNKLERVIFFPIENPDVEEREFRAGQLHVTFNLPVTKIASWRKQEPTRLRADPTLQVNFLRFNTSKPPLDDPRVRRALSLAIDRDALARSVLQGSREPARALTPPGTGGYTARAGVPTDVGQARLLLAAAGHAGGKDLPVIDIQCRNDEIMPKLAEALQQIWQRELGVRTTISQLEQKTWIQNMQTLNYGISTAAWTADFPDPVTFLGMFTENSAYNWTGWKHAEYDKLLATAATTADPQARYELLQQAEARLLAESPVAPLHFGAQTYLIDPAVKGWEPAPLVFRRFQLVDLKR